MMDSKKLALKTAEQLKEKKAMDVAVIDISPKASFADFFVMASGGSDRQMSRRKNTPAKRMKFDGVSNPRNAESADTAFGAKAPTIAATARAVHSSE